MNDDSSNTHPVDAETLWTTLQELEAGTLPVTDRDALMEWLARSPEAQNAYLEYFELSAMIADEAKTHSEISSLPCVAVKPESKASQPSILRMPGTLWMAAAAVVILALCLHPLLTNRPPAASMTISAVPGSQWTVDGQTATSNNLAEGSTLRVSTGSVKLHHPSGARLIVQGPAAIVFPQLHKPIVESGWVWIDNENDNLMFEVTTPELLIRDIGTRFGVHVPQAGSATLHLLDGQIDAFSRTNHRKLASLKPEDRAIEINAEGEATALALSPDPFPSIIPLLSKADSYGTTLLSQSPSGYWKLDDALEDDLTNLAVDGTAGRLHPQLRHEESGPQGTLGFPGFGKGNKAVRFSGTGLWAPLSLGSAPVHNETLFQEIFASGGTLHRSHPAGAMRDVRWVATPAFQRNGDIAPSATGTATLAFTPVNGAVYTLDASFRDLHATGEADDAWIALGFAKGQGISSRIYGWTENRFLEGQTTGRAWMLFRATENPLEHTSQLGTTGKNGGLADQLPWTNWNRGYGGDVDMRVVLDTTSGAGHWTATWYAKRPSDPEYTMVRATTKLINEAINSVGIAVGKQGVSGNLKSFVLKAASASTHSREERLADAPSTLTRHAGAVSFWIKPQRNSTSDQIIWTAGNAPDNDSMHLRITPSGHLRFFIDNDRYDLSVTSDSALFFDTWQHVVATWGPDAAEIHLNGKRIGSVAPATTMPSDELPDLYVGSGPLGSRFANFTGTIDEFATWNRRLSPAEIQRQYESALSSPPP